MTEPARWYCGVQFRQGRSWLWPRACWEYSIDKAKATARRLWPMATTVGVQCGSERWIHEQGKGWSQIVEPPLHVTRDTTGGDVNRWWMNRD